MHFRVNGSALLGAIHPIRSVENLFSKLNPFNWIRDQAIDLYRSLGAHIEQFIVNTPRPVPGAWEDYLYGNSWGLGAELAIAVALSLLTIGMFWHRMLRPAALAAVIVAFIGMADRVWFPAANGIASKGGEIAQAFSIMRAPDPNGGNNQLLILPDIKNTLGAITGIGILLFLGGLLILLFFVYNLAAVAAVFLGLPLLALMPLGNRPRMMFIQIVGLGLVTMFLGRILAVLALDLGNIAVNYFPLGNDVFGSTMYLAASFALALALNVWLLKQASAVYGNVYANANSHGSAEVRGKVDANANINHEVDVNAFSLKADLLKEMQRPLVVSPKVPAPGGGESVFGGPPGSAPVVAEGGAAAAAAGVASSVPPIPPV